MWPMTFSNLLSILFYLLETTAFSFVSSTKERSRVLWIARASDVIARTYPVEIVEFKNGTSILCMHTNGDNSLRF